MKKTNIGGAQRDVDTSVADEMVRIDHHLARHCEAEREQVELILHPLQSRLVLCAVSRGGGIRYFDVPPLHTE